jgi:HTH-type transcriptional regulator/antitoxin HigA
MATETRAAKASRRQPSTAYMALIRRFPLRPIRSDGDHRRAIAVIDELAARDDLTREEMDYVDVLSDLVERYEEEHEPEPQRTGVDALRFLIEQSGHSQAEIADQSGSGRSTLTEILKGKRGMSRKVIDALARRFRVEPRVFLDDPGARQT